MFIHLCGNVIENAIVASTFGERDRQKLRFAILASIDDVSQAPIAHSKVRRVPFERAVAKLSCISMDTAPIP